MMEEPHATGFAPSLDIASTPLRRAQALRAQGRMLDAIETLAQALNDHRDDANDVACAFIEMLEAAGEARRLVALADQSATLSPASQLALARALLSLGEFARAASLASDLLTVEAHAQQATFIRSIASVQEPQAWMVSETPPNAQFRAAEAAALWLRAMLGRFIVDQVDGRACGADPHTSVLLPLVQRAARTLQAAMESADSGDARRNLEPHLRACLRALGAPSAERAEHAVRDAGSDATTANSELETRDSSAPSTAEPLRRAA